MILFTLPLTLLIGLLIKLQDRGPLFYGHKRIAIAGKEFSCLKFRSMHVDADKKLDEIILPSEINRYIQHGYVLYMTGFFHSRILPPEAFVNDESVKR